ncbi:2-polyprenyl-3-methyl-5-hydroxy-6-metoxy-1,4-benzoquinol methylase [Microbacterium endophyticum]|uniref:2-polyprenyl-3-methyl-5-hydroxy-6-metoxy-1, 4-benzoquinol methylase n=1 Tax=Microbacterium endophyticum TaxID=1526412 RepID=A0A7W4YNR6_9MICO|nr:methyltransferase domain-containing protein [Microbacterium endophyticum]MBB2976839.1 2-polyprenyl-3-methyl-5-hydroxy-6-metoxy-1,4-benzoquinol methylase [Microbacterium endophyticum]NIK35843.1 2-polyprenyl-3-methyl-5-hydroxy-6-metoxy-1,4-benzoquinol methylase [Microbacterium endophyticum]
MTSLSARNEALQELMDNPHCDQKRLRATLRRFGLINPVIAGWGGLYRGKLRPYLTSLRRPARVLDLGCGGGDVTAHLAKLSRRDGLRVEWVGVDPEPTAFEVASTRTRENLRFIHADAAGLLAAGDRFDAVISNHVVHHLGDALPEFFELSQRLSTGPVLHADIARSRRAYMLYTVGVTPFAPGTFLRTDGLRSIRRSFTARELQELLDRRMPTPWRVTTPGAFRVLAEGRGHV